MQILCFLILNSGTCYDIFNRVMVNEFNQCQKSKSKAKTKTKNKQTNKVKKKNEKTKKTNKTEHRKKRRRKNIYELKSFNTKNTTYVDVHPGTGKRLACILRGKVDYRKPEKSLKI